MDKEDSFLTYLAWLWFGLVGREGGRLGLVREGGRFGWGVLVIVYTVMWCKRLGWVWVWVCIWKWKWKWMEREMIVMMIWTP